MAVASIILAAEEAAESGGGGLGLLLPAKPELIAGIVAFALVFLFVRWKAAPSINRSLEVRQQAIGGQMAEAEKAKLEAESLLADYKTQLAEIRAKQNELMEEARTAAEALKTDILAKAQAEAEAIVGKAREEAAAEKGRVLTEARTEVANLSIDLAEKVVGANLDRATQLGMVERYLAELEK